MFAPNASQRMSLVDVAMRRADADLVLTHARLVNVHTREILLSDIAIKNGRIAVVAAHGSVPWHAGEPQFDVGGQYVCPGFIDPHVHVESSMVTLREFARAVVPRGVTTIAADPHEIGNVLGVDGMKAFMDEARTVPLRVLLRVPGRIPAMPAHLETAGAELDLRSTQEMLDWPEAVCLAGDINPSLLLHKDAEQFAKIDLAIRRAMTVSGQSPGLAGATLCAYVAAGPQDSHVALDVREVLDNQRLGLRSILTIREGRRLGRAQFRELAKLARAGNLDTRYLQLCTDDVLPHRLEDEGHLDFRARVAIEEGFDAPTAIQMATINVAEGLRIDRDFGSITPGKHADLLLLSDLDRLQVEAVMVAGRWIPPTHHDPHPLPAWQYPAWARQTVYIQPAIQAQDLQLPIPPEAASATVRALTTGTPKSCEAVRMPVRDGAIQPDPARGVSAIAMLDRHTGRRPAGRGFMAGLHLKRGAMASTVSHDAHNLRIIGASYADMAVAANRAVEIGGGYVLALDGRVILELPLPVAGLMSEQPLAQVARTLRDLEKQLQDVLGCPAQREMMLLLSNFCLPNIPRFGFTDFGLVSTQEMEIVAPVVTFFDAAGTSLAPPMTHYGNGRAAASPALSRHCGCGG